MNFYYSVMSKARSDLRFGGFLTQSIYNPGSPMKLVLEPILYGQPVRLDLPVETRFTRPDGTIRIISLTETTYGQYQGTFDDTSQLGIYPISAIVTATTPAGALVTRYRYFTGLIFLPGRNGDNPHGGGNDNNPDCREAQVLQKRLEALLHRLAEKYPEESQEVTLLLDG